MVAFAKGKFSIAVDGFGVSELGHAGGSGPQGLKPASLLVRDGMAEAMPFPVVSGDGGQPQR